jgi:nitroreductase
MNASIITNEAIDIMPKSVFSIGIAEIVIEKHKKWETTEHYGEKKDMTNSLDITMSLEQAIRERRSVRGFLSKAVPEDIINKAFELAQLSPSNSNIQPWKVYVASGESRNIIQKKMVELITGGDLGKPDFEYPMTFEGEYRKRQVDCAVALYKEMGIARDDQLERMNALLRNFEFFDAPHMAFICMEKDFPQSVAVDVGMYAQTLMLTLTALGVSSCPMGAMRNHPQVPREVFGFGDHIGVLFGIAFGYEDTAVPANNTRVGRVPYTDCVQFKS